MGDPLAGKPLKIGIVAMGLGSQKEFGLAGVARYSYSLMDAFVAGVGRQHEFHFYVMPSFEVPAAWAKAPNVKISRTWPRYNKWTLLVSGLVAKGHGLDFLLSTENSVPLFSPVPTGVFIHDLFPLDHPEWFPESTSVVNGRTIPQAVKRSRLVLVNSESTKRDVIRHFGTNEGKVAVTPLAGGNKILRVDSAAVDRAALTGFKRYILTLSTIEPRKNLGRLFEAFAHLKDSDGLRDVGLVVAGSKGWKYDEALAKIESLHLESRVKLLGYVSDSELPALYAGCEFYVCPSVSEGFGMPLVEAMEAGTPVLSSNGGALPEVGGDAVRYFDPLNVEEMAAALTGALRDPEEREVWTQKGLAQAGLFRWEKTALATIAEIERCL